MSTSVLSRVQRILADIFQISGEQITPMSSPDTIENWDSLNHLNVVLALEQEFGVRFMPEEIEQLLSVEHIAALLDEKLHVAGKSP
jgi:acyl carrier protein